MVRAGVVIGLGCRCMQNPKGPCTQVSGTWVLRNSNYSIGFG